MGREFVVRGRVRRTAAAGALAGVAAVALAGGAATDARAGGPACENTAPVVIGIENNAGSGAGTLSLGTSSLTTGVYLAPPATTIAEGQTGTFCVQPAAGVAGGGVQYNSTRGTLEMTYNLSNPTSGPDQGDLMVDGSCADFLDGPQTVSGTVYRTDLGQLNVTCILLNQFGASAFATPAHPVASVLARGLPVRVTATRGSRVDARLLVAGRLVGRRLTTVSGGTASVPTRRSLAVPLTQSGRRTLRALRRQRTAVLVTRITNAAGRVSSLRRTLALVRPRAAGVFTGATR